jgi:hypothetical protein
MVDSFSFPSGRLATARQEGTTDSPPYRPHRIFLTSERFLLIQYCWRREPLPDLLSMHGFGGDLGPLGGKWLSETLTSTVRNPDLRRHERSYLQAQRFFLEKLEPTSTRVLSYSATNLLRQNRKSDGNESNKVNTTPRSCNMILPCIMCIVISDGAYKWNTFSTWTRYDAAAIFRRHIASPWEQKLQGNYLPPPPRPIPINLNMSLIFGIPPPDPPRPPRPPI